MSREKLTDITDEDKKEKQGSKESDAENNEDLDQGDNNRRSGSESEAKQEVAGQTTEDSEYLNPHLEVLDAIDSGDIEIRKEPNGFELKIPVTERGEEVLNRFRNYLISEAEKSTGNKDKSTETRNNPSQNKAERGNTDKKELENSRENNEDVTDINLEHKEKPYISTETLLSEIKEVVEGSVDSKDIADDIEKLEKMSRGEIADDPVVIDRVLEFLDDYELALKERRSEQKNKRISDEELKKITEDSRFAIENVLEKSNQIGERTEEASPEVVEALAAVQDFLGGKSEMSVDSFNDAREKIKKARKLLQGKLDRRYGETEKPTQGTIDHETKEIIKTLDSAEKALDYLYDNLPTKGSLDEIRIPEWREDLIRWQERMILNREEKKLDEAENEFLNENKEGEKEKEFLSEEEEQKEIDIIAVDNSPSLAALAWRIAESELNEIITQRAKGEKFSRKVSLFFRRIVSRLGERGYLEKFYDEAYESLEIYQDLRATIDARLRGESIKKIDDFSDKKETYEVLDAIVQQVITETLEREERGELIEGGELFSRNCFSAICVASFRLGKNLKER